MKRMPQIESDTPLRPRAVAMAVWEEASAWLDDPLPRRWIRELIAQADTVYARNERFRRKMRGEGSRGREWLWVFTRHWLAAMIKEYRPHLHARLPESYNTGHALPPKPAAAARPKMEPFKTLPPSRVFRVTPVEQAWAAAAHFHLV